MSDGATLSPLRIERTDERGLTRLAELGRIPDPLLRLGIRRLCSHRLSQERFGGEEAVWSRFQRRLEELRHSPLALHTDVANRQHYELPPRFFQLCLGKRLKYSSCYYANGDETLEQAEDSMLALYGVRAELADGHKILELGCGWGSLTLWMATRFPQAQIVAVSNSRQQREHIEGCCRRDGIDNVRVITQDVNQLQLDPDSFDRVVSVEMFEHVRNYQLLLQRIAGWLRPDGRLFVHIFCHRELMYPFETEAEDDWMGRHFFTGGLMPAADTFMHFQQDLVVEQQWRLSGRHYEQTANHWLARQDAHRDEIMEVLSQAYGEGGASLWNQRWRMFWMACAELFGYSSGDEWMVGHYRFHKR